MDSLIGETRAEGVRESCRAALEQGRELLGRILGCGGPRTRGNTLEPLDRISTIVGNAWNLVALLRSVHPDSAVRTAAEEAEKEIASFYNDLSLNRDLYEAVSRCDTTGLDALDRRMLKHLLRDFHRAGVDRDDAVRERVRVLREELVAIGQDFLRNIVSDVRAIELRDASELEGLPDDYIRKRLTAASGPIRISTDYPDYNPFMTYARSASRRRELYTVFRKRAHPANGEVLKRLIAKRHELASLLGYASWAQYITEDKMIRTPDAIADFIEKVSAVAERRAAKEYRTLLDEKRKEQPGAAVVFDWEKAFLEEQVRSRAYQVDSKKLRNYFEYGRVKQGILDLTEELFGVRFVLDAGAAGWHEDVEAYRVLEDGREVGRVYLDMHPREGKFKHAAMFPIRRGLRSGPLPAAALVCNFPDPRAAGGPVLLEHDEVLTFLHEFGHLLHQLFARDHVWSRFSGVATEWDFIEVPSQLYEEWGWDFGVLQRLARHHETGEPLPADLFAKMRAARGFGRGLWVRHQLFYAALSLRCFGPGALDADPHLLARELQDRYSLFRFVEGTHFEASFGHLDDYSALYYTYMWSLVIEKDFFEEFKRRGLMSGEAARSYREQVLAPGGSRDAADLVRSFLGRDHDFAAFEAWVDES